MSLPLAMALVAGLMVTAPACASLGGALEDVVVPEGRSTQVSGEVHSVDTRRNRIYLREERGGARTVHYDGRTRVVYRQRAYPASALERGDLVQVRVVYDRNGTPWADRVEVRRSVRDRDWDRDRDRDWGRDRDWDRREAWWRVERLDGTVQWLDTRRGYFSLDRGRQRSVVVYVPRTLRRDDVRRFERLRRGERVRVEVRQGERGVTELVRFR